MTIKNKRINMKICTICKIEKNKSDFYKHNKTKDGLNPQCKACHLENTKAYRRTFKGLITEIYSQQKKSCKIRKMEQPGFTKKELFNWCENSLDFMRLYQEWVESNYHIDKRPTTDRKDDMKTYTFDNMQPLTYRQNVNKYHNSLVNGTTKRVLKPVLQYDLEGNFIKEYFSITEASRQIGGSQSKISACIAGQQKTSSGFIWKLKHKGKK